MQSTKSSTGDFWLKMGRNFCVASLAAVMVAGSFGLAQAKDAVRAKIENYGSNGFVTENGTFQTPGTYAIGTLKLDYTISAFDFSLAQKTFNLCLDTIEGKPKPATNYPVDVTIEQIGSDKLLLAIDSGPVRFEGAAEQACVEVTATVPAWIANDPDFQEDGTKLGGIIRLATPPRSHLDTVTTVKVSFTLTHPSATACVRALHLVANHSFDNDYSDAGIALSFQTSQGKLSSSPNDLQHLLALVNSCTYHVSVDLNTAINENFDLHQTSAVRTTALEQVIVDIDDLLDVNLNWDNLTNQGGNMCLQGIVIPARQTFVLAQRNRIKEGGLFPGEYADNLDPSRALGSWEYDGYTYATHLTGGTECADLAFSTDVDPSQGSVAVPVNEVSFTGTQPTEYPPQE